MYLGTEEVINWAGIPVPDLILSQKKRPKFLGSFGSVLGGSIGQE